MIATGHRYACDYCIPDSSKEHFVRDPKTIPGVVNKSSSCIPLYVKRTFLGD
jgi:hypothetical protein